MEQEVAVEEVGAVVMKQDARCWIGSSLFGQPLHRSPSQLPQAETYFVSTAPQEQEHSSVQYDAVDMSQRYISQTSHVVHQIEVPRSKL